MAGELKLWFPNYTLRVGVCLLWVQKELRLCRGPAWKAVGLTFCRVGRSAAHVEVGTVTARPSNSGSRHAGLDAKRTGFRS